VTSVRLRRRHLLVAVGVLVVASLVGAHPWFTLAGYTDMAASTATITGATLHPPTSLAAAGGTSASLTWTPTIDAVATGYNVLRGAASGGPYAQIGTVTPKTAAATGDAPSTSGTYYYVLQTYYQNWVSTNSNQASATVVLAPVTLPYAGCASGSNVAETGGDNNGYETTPNNACASGGGSASDANTGTFGRSATCNAAANDRHSFWGYSFGLPASVWSVSSITVRADAARSQNGGTSNLCIQLSWDGGTTWSSILSKAVTSNVIATYTFGGAVATWGAHTWTAGNLSSTNFRVRVYDATTGNANTYTLDYLAVQVVYVP
jgi:hypothetical protein